MKIVRRGYSFRPINRWIASGLALIAANGSAIPLAVNPSAWSAPSSASAAALCCVSQLASTAIVSPGEPVIPMVGRPGLLRTISPPFHSIWTHPAAASEFSICTRNLVASVSCTAAASNFVFANCFNFSVMRPCCSGDSVLGARNFSNANLASAARSLASAVSFRSWSPWSDNVAMLFAAASLARSQWCSLTMPIHTIAIVASTPKTRLPTSTKLARSNIQAAVSNDGHGSFAWVAISAMAVIAVIGIGGLIGIGRAIRWRR